MKKSYVKPQVYFEDFQLSASIAANCADGYKNDPNVTPRDAVSGCGYTLNGNKVFVSSPDCYYESQTGEDYGLCYHVPADANRLFAS